MKTSVYFVRTYKNNCSKSVLLTFEHDCSRSDAILKLLSDKPELQDCYMLCGVTKCNVTLDFTAKMQYPAAGRFDNDVSCYTFSEWVEQRREYELDENCVGISSKTIARFHFSKSGRALDYLIMNNLIEKREYESPCLFHDSKLYFENLKFTRNAFNEVVPV